MRIVSWNVNGIRATMGKGFEASCEKLQPDLLCLQETKAHPSQVDIPLHSPLARWGSTWSSAEKKGYSGTAVFSRVDGFRLENSMGEPHYDSEGRATLAYGKDFTVVNLYFPNGAASPERHQFKMTFLDRILPWLKALEAAQGPLVIVGDYNIAHKEIDIHDPKGNKDSSGFLPEERAWMSRFLEAGFVDTFRHFHPEKTEEYSWWSFRQASRERNKGWRIDYICVSESLKPRLKAAAIHQDIHGSDHCPISVDID